MSYFRQNHQSYIFLHVNFVGIVQMQHDQIRKGDSKEFEFVFEHQLKIIKKWFQSHIGNQTKKNNSWNSVRAVHTLMTSKAFLGS